MVELCILREGRAWHNFVRANLDHWSKLDTNRVQTSSFDDLNDFLKPYGGRIIEYQTQTVTFDTEQDKAFFMLKWA